NAVLIDIFVIGIVVAFYEYQRRVNRAADDAQKELTVLGTLGGRDSVPRKVELIDLLASNGRKPISLQSYQLRGAKLNGRDLSRVDMRRSEEHTSELQSPYDLVCRLLLEKK